MGHTVTAVFAFDPVRRYAIWETNSGQVACDAEKGELTGDVVQWTRKLRHRSKQVGVDQRQANSEIAAAYKLFFDDDPQGCEAALKDSYEELTARLGRRAKVAFLGGTLVTAVACVGVCGFLYSKYASHPSLSNLLAALGAGGLGGFVSVARDLAKVKNRSGREGSDQYIVRSPSRCDRDDRRRRCVISNPNRCNTAFLEKREAFDSFILVCFLAGFGERLVYRALSQMENAA